MNIHSRARTTPFSRGLLVDRVKRQGWSVAQAAAGASISLRTGYKWLARAKVDPADLHDRRSPNVCPD